MHNTTMLAIKLIAIAFFFKIAMQKIIVVTEIVMYKAIAPSEDDLVPTMISNNCCHKINQCTFSAENPTALGKDNMPVVAAAIITNNTQTKKASLIAAKFFEKYHSVK